MQKAHGVGINGRAFKVKLIRQVQHEPCLYATRHPQFWRKDCKLKAWDRIAKEMGQDVFLCERRWIHLRERFSREKRKFDNTPEKERASLVKWELMDHMAFLNEYVKPRHREKDRKRCFELVEVEPKKSTDEDSCETFDTMNETNSIEDVEKTIKVEIVDSEPDPDGNDTIMDVIKLVETNSEDFKEPLKEGTESEDEMFMKLAVKMMQPLSIGIKDRIRKDFMNMIFEERRKIFSGT